jgi:hypothetical protein
MQLASGRKSLAYQGPPVLVPDGWIAAGSVDTTPCELGDLPIGQVYAILTARQHNLTHPLTGWDVPVETQRFGVIGLAQPSRRTTPVPSQDEEGGGKKHLRREQWQT